MDSARMIVKEGYKPGPGDAHGKGIYSSPSLEMVERYYAKEFELEGKRYKIALQNRVNPDQGAGRLEITAASVTGTGADYWLSPAYNDDVRPYGILIREVPKSTSNPAVQAMNSFATSPGICLQPCPQPAKK